MASAGSVRTQIPTRVLGPDPALAAEFRATPLGHHSDALTRLLRVLRSEPLEGKHVVVCVQPFRQYRLGRLTARRGAPVALLPGLVFDSPAAAEWAVFLRRWEGYFGEPLDVDAVDRAAAGAGEQS
ncbi:MAG: hypothetical protein JWP46_3138 [Modestobacter sp.]|nr:hypothetical protein [Modestobacter sp.]